MSAIALLLRKVSEITSLPGHNNTHYLPKVTCTRISERRRITSRSSNTRKLWIWLFGRANLRRCSSEQLKSMTYLKHIYSERHNQNSNNLISHSCIYLFGNCDHNRSSARICPRWYDRHGCQCSRTFCRIARDRSTKSGRGTIGRSFSPKRLHPPFASNST